jgi:hypothetical protein
LQNKGQQAGIEEIIAYMTRGYQVSWMDCLLRNSNLLLEQYMTILYLKDIKRSRTESAGTSSKLSATSAGGVVELAERRSWWPSVAQRLQFPQQLRKLKNYAPSSSWLPEHSSQLLDCLHDRRS